jgi:hypothetical protein
LRIVLIALLAAGLAGCGTYKWERQGASTADWPRESQECEQQVAGTAQSAPQAWENCMMGRGWRYSGSWF